MELFIVDAFATRIFEGNQAGVVLLREGEAFPPAQTMLNIAAELKHSETAFIKPEAANTFALKFYTPTAEVALCGHATLSAFTVLRNKQKIGKGTYFAKTLSGVLNIMVDTDCIWMEMPRGRMDKELSRAESLEIYQAYGLAIEDQPIGLTPCVVNAGLSDILLPVNCKEKLDRAMQQRERVLEITRKHHAVGVHMFFQASMRVVPIYCRNFAPLYGIDEESATGTSNAALTFYLSALGFIQADNENVFMQGEAMGKPAVIKSRMSSEGIVSIGGNAIVSVQGTLAI